MKKRLLLLMIVYFTTLSYATELQRTGWNLIAVCQDMNASDVNMTNIEEIQNQNGKSIYTGEFKEFSNLDKLEAGYGYWVKGSSGSSFFSGSSIGKLEKPLLREEWNLMASCEDRSKSDMNMSNLVEIQNQDGKSIYTGEFESFSNLESLDNGYGYWVKGAMGTLFTAKRGLTIPLNFIYQTINNQGTAVESSYEDYSIKLFSDYNLSADSQSNHTAVVVRINGINTPILQIQEGYRGRSLIVGVYDTNDILVATSEVIVVPVEGTGTFIDVHYSLKSDADSVADDKSRLTFDAIRGFNLTQSTILSNLLLPTVGENGTSISWLSSNLTVLSNDGVVHRPTLEEGDVELTLMATIIKGDEEDTITFTLTVEAEDDVVIPTGKHFAVGYLPTWGITGFDEADANSSQIATIDELYTHVVISFAKPDMTFNGTDFSGTGVEFNSHLGAIKKAIEALQARGVKVLLAVGGATYNNWQPLADEQGAALASTTHKKALKAFVDYFNLDGIDVDYEVSGADSANVDLYYKSILALKEVAGDKLLTAAGWSTGADCTAGTATDADCNGKVSYWGGSAGRERLTFKKLRENGYSVEEIFDYIAIMTYDGSVGRFDPITLFKNYQAIYNGALAIGFEIPKESWGGAEIVATNAQALACESTSMITGDSYTDGGDKQPYSVERFVDFINTVPNSGVMVWSLYRAKNATTCADALGYDTLTIALRNSIDINSTELPPVTAESKYHDVLGLSLKFYEAQRAVGPFPTVTWRQPASTHDGADVGVDLNGGWFDAGDHVKFNLPMSYSVGMLNWSLIANEAAYTQAGKLAYGKDQVKYALDYLLNTYQAGDNLDSPDDDKVYFQVADGHADHNFWGPPEELNMERKTFTCDADGGCAAVAGSMVGAFASGAMVFKDDSAYSQKLLESAKRLYKFAMKYQTDLDYSSVGQDFYALYENTHNEDQLAWGAIWLYQATNETQYLSDAKNIMSGIYPWSGHSWDNMALGVFTLLTELTHDNSYGTLVEKELDKWVNKDIPTSAGGLRVLQQWGSLRYASTASYIALMYSDLLSDGAKKEGYIGFAKSQIDYILGENPQSFSYVVGYGEHYPLQPHHRAASGTTEADPNPNKYVIEGSLVGGPKSASDTDYTDSRSSYIDNEVATDYNAGFTGALAKLALLYGEPTTPKTDSEIVALDKAGLTFDTIKNQNSAENQITSDLNLITSGAYGSNISWQSSNTGALSSTGVVTASSTAQTVTLTATMVKGSVSDTKTFTLTILAEQSDTDRVAQAKEALTFEMIKNQNAVADDIQSNLTLATQGSFDTTIVWSSSNTAVISNAGVVQRGAENVTVILTATISKGTVSDSKTFTLIVTKEAVQEGACQVDYHIRDEWGNGATIDVSVTNQIANLYGWEVTFSFPSGQTINNLWNGIKTQTDNFVKVVNESYNAQINQGQKIEFGFVVDHNGRNEIPTDIRLNGKLCDGQTGGITKPAKPTNLLADLISNSQVTLTWNDNSDNEDNFLVYKSIDLNSWELLVALEANSTTYQESGLEVGHTYEYKVEAKNIAGKTESDKVSVTPNRIDVQEGISNQAISLVANCASCHAAGNSDDSIPVIHGLDKAYLVDTLKGYQNGTHFGYVMPRIMDGYSDDEVERMADYFANAPWVGNRAVSYDVNTIETGKALYESNCKVCHGEDAKRAVAKVDISSQSENYLIDTMTQYAKGLHTNGNEGMLSTFTDTIGQDASKIEAIAKYLSVGLQIPEGDNDTIRGFDAYYQNSTNTIVLSWDYINPETEQLEVMVNDSVVQTITDFNKKSVTLVNDGSDNFVIGQTYALKIKSIHGSTQTLSRQVLVEVLSDESKGQEHYNSQCKVCHGVNGTQRADITAWNPAEHTFAQLTRESSMDEMYYSGCDDECLELIGIYVQNILAPRAKDNNNSNNAEDVNSDLKRGYRLLNRMEYTNTLYSLFEIDNDETKKEQLALHYTDLPKDNIFEGYNTDREMIRMDEDKVRALNLMASKVENYLASLKGKNSNSCWIGDYNFCTADQDEFLDGFATKIFRRPLTAAEKSTYKSLGSVSKMVGDMLVSPKFLYRSERGAVTAQSGIYQLTQYEIATNLAYTIAGTTPDDALLTLASEGKLLDANTRVTQAVRLSQLQTGKDKLDDFIGRWLLEDSVYSLSDKNPERFVGYTPEVRNAQSRQVLKFFRMVMEDTENSTYKDLFINDKIVTNKTLSDYYAEGTSSSSEFETIPATDKRYGILTLGAVASKYANSEEAHPFKRGKFVLKRLMCHPMGPPGNGGDVPAIQNHKGENKRDRYSTHVNDPSCAACHDLLDPIGFTWEKYDGTGRYRTSEYHSAEDGGAKPIDASVTLKGLLTFDTSETHASEGIRDMSELIAQSDRGPECMALQYYRYTSGDSHADIENSRVVKKIASDFKAENYDLQGLFTNIVKLKSFITRVGE